MRKPGKPKPIGDINYRLSAFINAFTLMQFTVMGVSVVGIIMKYYNIGGGGFVFVFSMAMLALLYLVQIGLSFFYVFSQFKLSLLGAFSSIALALGFLAMAFRYQNWWGWQVMFFIAIPVFIITAIFIGWYLSGRQNHHHYSHGLHNTHRKFLVRNLLVPYLYIVLLGILSFAIDKDEFEDQPNIHQNDFYEPNQEAPKVI